MRQVDIYMYSGGIAEPRKILCGVSTAIEDNETIITSKTLWGVINNFIREHLDGTGVDKVYYTRVCGPDGNDGNFYVDFGSYSYFVWINYSDVFDKIMNYSQNDFNNKKL